MRALVSRKKAFFTDFLFFDETFFPTQKRSAEKLPPKQPSVSHAQAPETDGQPHEHAFVPSEKQKSAEATAAAEHVGPTEPENTAGQLNGSKEKAKSVDQTVGPNEHRLAKQGSNDSDKSRKSSHDGGKVSRRNSNESDKPLARSSGKIERTSETTDEAKPVDKALNDKPKSSKSKKADGKTEADKPAANKNATDKKADKQYNDHPMEMPSKNANDAARPSKPAVSALRSAVARPVSARPSAPRRRDRNMKQILHTENFVQDSSEQSKAVRNAVLPEFDEDENVVITNAIEDNLLQFGEAPEAPMPNDPADKQGHLVQQILETQTAILKGDGSNDTAQVFVAVIRCYRCAHSSNFVRKTGNRREHLQRSHQVDCPEHGRTTEIHPEAVAVYHATRQDDGIFPGGCRCDADRIDHVAKSAGSRRG